ncbi:hypothetical protein ALC56_05477, partial [Trachymyrmex septentrionalis]
HSIQYDNVIRPFKELQLMCDKYPRLTVEIFGDALPIEMPSNTSINRAQGIVEQIDIRLSINCPCEIDSRSLTTGQRYTSIADHCYVSLWKLSKTILPTITLDHEKYLHVSSIIIGLAKQYIVPYGTTEKPRFLTGIGDTQIWIVLMKPVAGFNSFNSRCNTDDLPEPTAPTTIHNLPGLIVKLILHKVGGNWPLIQLDETR